MTTHSSRGPTGPGQDGAETRPNIFGRTEELEQLRQRVARRHAFLYYGPAGVGKTFLLSASCPISRTFSIAATIPRRRRCSEAWRNCFCPPVIRFSRKRARTGRHRCRLGAPYR